MIDLYGSSVEIFFVPARGGQPRSIHNVAKSVGGFNGRAPDFANFVDRVSVEINLFRFTTISVTLTPPIDEAIALINSGILGLGFGAGSATGPSSSNGLGLASAAKVTNVFNKMKLRLHSGGLSSAWMEGILLAPDVSIGADSISITIKAMGLLWDNTRTSSAKPFRSKSGQEILNQLTNNGEKYEITINPKDSRAKAKFDKILNLNQNISNWQTVADLLEKENCRLIDRGAESIDGKTRYEVISMEYARSRTDMIRTFVAFQQIDPNKGIFPILSFETSLVNYMAGMTIGSVLDSFDSSNKQPSTKNQVGAKTANDFSSKVVSSDKSTPGGPEDGKTPPKISTPAGRGEDGHPALDMIKGAFQSVMDSPMKFMVTTLALVDQLPGRIANVRIGDAKFLKGSYDVLSVTHEIGQGTAETTLELGKTFGLIQAAQEGLEAIQSKDGSSSGSGFKESSALGLLPNLPSAPTTPGIPGI